MPLQAHFVKRLSIW